MKQMSPNVNCNIEKCLFQSYSVTQGSNWFATLTLLSDRQLVCLIYAEHVYTTLFAHF